MYQHKEYSWLGPSQKLVGNTLQLELNPMEVAKPTSTDFHKEIDRAVCHIANVFNKPKYLALSGGLDSEYVANALVRNKIEFTPILVSIEKYNSAELWYAEHWCKKNNIAPIRISVDSVKLLNFMHVHCVPKYLTVNLGGYVNVFIADYVKKALSGILITGCGDPTINPFGIYSEGSITDKDPEFYYWDIDLVLDILRPGEHPRATLAYFPDTLHSYVYNYDINLTEQEAKSNMYEVPIRPKLDVFGEVPEWISYMNNMSKFIKTSNFKLGTKYQTLDWLTKERERGTT